MTQAAATDRCMLESQPRQVLQITAQHSSFTDVILYTYFTSDAGIKFLATSLQCDV